MIDGLEIVWKSCNLNMFASVYFCFGGDNVKIDPKRSKLIVCGLDSFGSGYNLIANFYENKELPSGCVRGG